MIIRNSDRIFEREDSMSNEPENIKSFTCPKCSNSSFETGEIRTTGAGLSRFLDLQNQKFAHITCDSCGYTEFFKRGGGRAGNILDLFMGG